ncbi:WAS/WASL-interacting protein family member 3-like [Sphaerodactylus townsendi]|uniref:WAS/WASL-interacting protein family member 3-like n=1 Tax=Sphaerodactylus townsendi TaxID=933632 RepID=UPI0020262EF2|nr:WAS/WASL-interacting protein family member 3-like [Sphaerodactylus townsendi]XP_048352941.1 WAS/WASL-interacting protein family member 3-like [Sphaerodactylus townsendi]XP_048352942.1 WAS/WASL-interacting protein family member 3-like [Sphaerodactylus townsendi]XP_048352943.1 WAS/WASL-interacting protein family member 3-like [Sphaerodactylus townsendi]
MERDMEHQRAALVQARQVAPAQPAPAPAPAQPAQPAPDPVPASVPAQSVRPGPVLALVPVPGHLPPQLAPGGGPLLPAAPVPLPVPPLMPPFMPPGWGAPGGVLPNFAPYGVAPPPFIPRVRLTTHFDGTQDLLPAFLVQVNAHMLQYGRQYLNDFERVCEIGSMLDGPAANWYVRLFQRQAAELRNLQDFMMVLHHHFESLFVGEQAKQELMEMRQGKTPFAEFVENFRTVASKIQDWDDPVKIFAFKKALHPDLINWAFVRDSPQTLMDCTHGNCGYPNV